MGVAGRLKIALMIVLLLLAILALLIVLPRHVTAQSNSCTEAIGGCNYEFTNTTSVASGYVGALADISNTITVRNYSISNLQCSRCSIILTGI